VSHHPPVGASYAENDNWTFSQAQQLKTKFTGNALDCVSLGTTTVTMKKHDEQYKWQQVNTTVHNVIIGKIWLDHYGDMEVKNLKTGERAALTFTKCGWFSKGWHEIAGTIYDAKGNATITIHGKWNEAIFGKLVSNINGKDSPYKKEILQKLSNGGALWNHTNKPLPASELPCTYMTDWTAHSLLISNLTEEMRNILPPTDSRIRADRYALEKEDVKTAASEKHRLEEKQRAEARARVAKGNSWVPRYFTVSKNSDHDWDFNGSYFKEREQRVAKHKN